jgi:hypothetical protein
MVPDLTLPHLLEDPRYLDSTAHQLKRLGRPRTPYSRGYDNKRYDPDA